MLEPFLNGILSGLLLAVFIGPVFFALIQSSIQQGFRSGVLLATGVSLSDACCAALCYAGFSQLNFKSPSFQESLALFGGLTLLGFGLSMIIKKPVLQTSSALSPNGRPGTFRYIIKGFALNAINPSVFLFWAAIITIASAERSYRGVNVIAFLSGIIFTVFTTDVAKAYVANRLRNYLTLTIMTWMNRLVGFALIAFGVKLLLVAFKLD